jgi:2,2-dialkylglycine decarboxylase (pyruvate)
VVADFSVSLHDHPEKRSLDDRLLGREDPGMEHRNLIRYGGAFVEDLIVSAEGSWVTTAEGRRILDFTAGQICATIGHNHPRVTAAIRESLDSVIHLNSWMLAPPVLDLAERLAGTLPDGLDRSLFLSTGGESIEVAVRMAKLATGGFEVASLTRSWHGLTGGAAALTTAGGRRGYGPNVPGSIVMPAPYAYRCPVRHCTDTCDMTCLESGFDLLDAASVGAPAAIVAEPVLSAGGIIVPPPGYFVRMLEMARERGMMLILDECQTGLGRLGTMYGFEMFEVVPDFLVLSKTLGGGVPIGAVVTSDAIEAICNERGFMHVTSHVSDPMPAAAALAVLDVVQEEDLAARAGRMGDRLLGGMRELQTRHECIGDVRGCGLLCGMELVRDRDTREPAEELGLAFTAACDERGLSMNLVRAGTGGSANCLRMAPPLTISEDEVDFALEVMDESLLAIQALPR